jgi:acyl-coenzyme A thioesterase PaaI-like protein
VRPLSCGEYERNLRLAQAQHHSKCLFTRNPPVRELDFRFTDSGQLRGTFTCTDEHQGYDSIAHGGIIAAVIDSAMAQCLMGHGVVGYTADLTIRYRTPVRINEEAQLKTFVEGSAVDTLYKMRCEIRQSQHLAVEANARFFRFASAAERAP